MTTNTTPASNRSVLSSLRQELETLCFQEKGNGRGILGEPHRVSDWVMIHLNPGTTIEGLSSDQRTSTGHRPLCFAVKRYRNYVTGFVEQQNGTLEFLPDRIYLHTAPPAHLYAAAPLWRPEDSLSRENVFRTPESVKKVLVKRLAFGEYGSLTTRILGEVLWCALDRAAVDPLSSIRRYSIAVSTGQLIRDIDKMIDPVAERIYPNYRHEKKQYPGGWWWNAVLERVNSSKRQPPILRDSKHSPVNRMLKLRDGYEAYDPISLNVAPIYQAALNLSSSGVDEIDLVSFVKRSKMLLLTDLSKSKDFIT